MLRIRTKETTFAEPLKVAKSKYANMSAMDLLKWGLSYNHNVNKGWLKDLLEKEGVFDGTKAAVQKRFWEYDDVSSNFRNFESEQNSRSMH